jgi:hypothetical protein
LNQGGDKNSRPAGLPDGLVSSLQDLESQRTVTERTVQHDESSREFYLALWKASPFVIIPLFTSALLAFATYGKLGYFFLVAFGSVAAVGLYSWYVTNSLDEQLTDSRAKAESARRALTRRMALVEAEFLKYRPSTNYLHFDVMSLDERIKDISWYNFKDQINPHLLKDMVHSDQSLVMAMESLDSDGFQFIHDVKEFYEMAHARLLEVNDRAGIDPRAQPPERLSFHIKALYYAINGIVSSPEEAEHPKRGVTVTPEMFYFFQLLFDEKTGHSPYNFLLKDDKLRKLALSAEKSRVNAMNNENSIRLAIQALMGDATSAFSPGI